jgi:hypothetical protein
VAVAAVACGAVAVAVHGAAVGDFVAVVDAAAAAAAAVPAEVLWGQRGVLPTLVQPAHGKEVWRRGFLFFPAGQTERKADFDLEGFGSQRI